jgi:DNA-binding GntR family transcriptional regulator
LTAPHDDAALVADATRAAIEHLRTARQLLKQTAALMAKDNSTRRPRMRIVQALKLAESALRTARRSQTGDPAGVAPSSTQDRSN